MFRAMGNYISQETKNPIKSKPKEQAGAKMNPSAIPLITIVMGVLLQMYCIQGQNQAFDLTKLLPKTGSEPIWTVIDRNLPQVQEMISAARRECVEKLNLPRDQRPLMKVSNPSEKEKCLSECVLKKIKLMDDNNKLNIAQVEKLTSLVTQDNKVAIAVSSSMASACNRGVSSKNACENAHFFNQCIGRQLERNNVKLVW
ncbi:uncharacterized protein Obp19c [Drosophila suzukii]|uniref:Uncharacterized protein Obp19c n=1 Tax=Drosophila suzukii TaxID=28584 RepID=A0AB39ZSK5_DROSZ